MPEAVAAQAAAETPVIELQENTDAVATEEVMAAILDTGKPKAKPEDKPEAKTKALDRAEDGKFKTKEPAGDAEEDEEVESAEDEEEVDAEDSDTEEDEGDDKDPDPSAVEEIEVDDDTLVEVMVDGKPQEVSFKELKADFSGRKYIEKNIQQAVETRKAVEHEAGVLFNNNKILIERLQRIDAALDMYAQPQVDWERLKREDPQQYIIAKEEQRDAQEKQHKIQQEIAKTNQEQSEEQAKALKRYTRQEADLLVKVIPEFGNPEKSKKIMSGIAETATHYGFTPHELGNVTDHRVIVALHDLMTLQQVIRQQTETEKEAQRKVKTRKRIKVPNASRKPAITARDKAVKRAVSRARETGDADDVAMTLLVPK